MSNAEKLNLAVVGLGMGRHHIEGYKKHPRAAVVALCDVNARRLEDLSKAHGIPPERCFTDYRKLLGQANGLGIRAASVALPHALRRRTIPRRSSSFRSWPSRRPAGAPAR